MADGDLTNEEAIGLKLDNTLHEVWNPSGHPSRKLMADSKADKAGKDDKMGSEEMVDGDGQEADGSGTADSSGGYGDTDAAPKEMGDAPKPPSDGGSGMSDGLKEPEGNPLFRFASCCSTARKAANHRQC